MYNVLIIEDIKLVAKDMSKVISKNGYSIAGISDNINDAESIVKNNNVDLAIVDLNLNGKLSGIDLAKMLYHKYNISIIFITAYSEDNINVDFDYDYISKPYNENLLIRLLRKNELNIRRL
jgi:two-component SAPR family response regulator